MINIESLNTAAVKDERVIIYPASRVLTAKEVMDITERVYDFLSGWAAHGKPLTTSFKIDYKQFIIILVDEEKEPASGCSMDSLNGLMRKIDEEYSLGLFDRMKASYIENEEIKTLPLLEFKRKLKNGEISRESKIFDFSKNKFQEFADNFLLPLEQSWANVFL